MNILQEMCEKPTPLGVGWIAQIMCMKILKTYTYYNIKGFDTSLILSLIDTIVSLVVKVL